MRPLYYILDRTGQPVVCRSVRLWARWMECVENAKVRQDHVCLPRYGKVLVSTIFMGLDHNTSGKGPALLWETTVVDGPSDLTRQFATRDEAVAYHCTLLRTFSESDAVPTSRFGIEADAGRALLN